MYHKKLPAILCAAALFVSPIPALAQDIQVLLDGNPIVFDVAPATVNDRTFVPLRAIGEALGAVVDWSEEEQKVTMTREGVTNELVIGSLTARRTDTDGTKEITLDAAPFTANDRTLVPVRYIAESFDMKVDWTEETQTVSITLPAAEQTPAAVPSGKKAIDFSGDIDDARKVLHHEIRYAFEQGSLPQTLLGDSDTVIDLLENNPEQLKQGIKNVWVDTVDFYLLQLIENAEEEYVINSNEDLIHLLDKFSSDLTLGADDVFTVSIETLSDGTPVVLLDLADIGTDSLDISCSYLALTYQKDKGLRYFTLETDPLVSTLAVCEVTTDSHKLYSYINNSKDLFLKTVETILTQELAPSAAINFPESAE